MITIEQIRAARGLLDLNQQELAKKTGLSFTALNKIERGVVKPREQTLRIIQHTLEMEGIEFIGNSGLQRREELFEFKRFEGDDIGAFTVKDIQRTLLPPHELLSVGVDEKLFRQHSKQASDQFIDHMRHHKVGNRTILATGATHFSLDPNHYRLLPKDMMGSIYWFTYADRFVIVNWKTPAFALWIRNKSIAETYQRQFEALWRLSVKIPDNHIKKATKGKSRL